MAANPNAQGNPPNPSKTTPTSSEVTSSDNGKND